MTTKNNSLVIKGLTVHPEEGKLSGGGVFMEEGVIKDIFENDQEGKYSGVENICFPPLCHLIPGMINIHIHGGNGGDVMDGDMGALRKIAASAAASGVTSFLATTMTEEITNIERALETVKEYINQQETMPGARIIGVHMEGPFLSPEKKGAQRADLMRVPDIDLFRRWQEISGDSVRVVTIAPELDKGLVFIEYLKNHNVIASIGHSDGSYEEAEAGIAAGAGQGTHLFNAMRGIHQRAPGTAGALLLDDRVTTELIVDGIHLHPAIVRLVLKTKGREKLILITDGIRATGLADGEYELGGQKVTVGNGAARLVDGTLAGSILTMNEAARNTIFFTGCGWDDIIVMTSENPARQLGLFDRKGSIAKGKDADVTVVDDKWQILLTVSGGRVVYRK